MHQGGSALEFSARLQNEPAGRRSSWGTFWRRAAA